jgi:rubrerythrin
MSMEDRLTIRDDADVDTAAVAEYEASRRDLLRRGLIGGGAAVAASSIPLLLGVRKAVAASGDGDAAVLTSAIGLEQVAVYCYDAALASGALVPAVRPVVKLFRDQEQEHVDALTAALKQLGGTPPKKPTSVAQVDRALGGVGIDTTLEQLRSQTDIAMFAIELENAAIGAYYDAHRKLRAARLLMAGAQIMANEGQHITVLRALVYGRDVAKVVPVAFESGAAGAG